MQNKQDAWWIWVALDAETRQVVAMVAGDRSEATAQCLWDALPEEYRDQAIVCTDFWSAYSRRCRRSGTWRPGRATA